MRIRRIAIVGGSTLALTACGSVGGKSASVLRSPTPVNLTVYVDNARVSVSPASVGAVNKSRRPLPKRPRSAASCPRPPQLN